MQLVVIHEHGVSNFRGNQKPTRGSTASALGPTKGVEPARVKWGKLHHEFLPLVTQEDRGREPQSAGRFPDFIMDGSALTHKTKPITSVSRTRKGALSLNILGLHRYE